MKCHEARELLIHYSNGEMGRSERELLQAHLAQCEACHSHLKSLGNVEQHVRAGLHEAANAAEPSPMAWQDLSHKLASRRSRRSTSHNPLPLVWRLMGGLSATIAFAVVVGAVIVSSHFGPKPSTLAITENAVPIEAVALNTGIHSAAGPPSESQTSAEQPDSATNVHGLGVPQRQSRALIQSEPDSFMTKYQVHNEPESEFTSQLSCSYCLKMR